jgi:polyadenylate-binding protein
MLFEKFNSIGPVASIRVCRDAITRRSLGYAYVNFTVPNDAENAINSLNFEDLRGRPMRIMWSQRDPSMRRSGVGNIYIKNLEKNIDNKALFDTFSAFGDILSCKVATDETGASRGYGMVHYDTAKAAELAIAKVNGMLLNDMKVYVGPFKSRKERLQEYEAAAKNFTNVYVKNLPLEVSDEMFDEMFGKFGPIQSRKLGSNDRGKFGFVSYEESNDARKAVEAMNGFKIGERELYVGRAQKKAERVAQLRRDYENRRADLVKRYQGVNLYIKNLSESINDARLLEAFQSFGNITSARVMSDERGASRGFGFVCFSTPEEATKAVTEMNGFVLDSKPLYVGLAQRREVRAQKLAMERTKYTMNQMGRMGPGMQPNMFQQNLVYLQQIPQGMRGNFGGFPGPRPRFVGQQQAPLMNSYPNRGLQQQVNQRVPTNPRAPQAGAGATRQPKGPRPGPGSGPVFRNNARNVMPGAGQMPGQESINPAMLASATENQQKQMLGERLYPLIANISSNDLAGKITGMLLEMDNSELLHLIEDSGALREKVQEAYRVLEEHAKTSGQAIPGLNVASE